MDAMTAAIITATAVRVPHTTRLKTSKPETVVPQICSADGGCWVPKLPDSSPVCSHVYGAMSGAKIAVSSSAAVRIRPVMSIARCSPAERMTSLIIGRRFHRAVPEEGVSALVMISTSLAGR